LDLGAAANVSLIHATLVSPATGYGNARYGMFYQKIENVPD